MLELTPAGMARVREGARRTRESGQALRACRREASARYPRRGAATGVELPRALGRARRASTRARGFAQAPNSRAGRSAPAPALRARTASRAEPAGATTCTRSLPRAASTISCGRLPPLLDRREWLVPHFEKMLYDQALHVLACTRGVAGHRQAGTRAPAEEVLDYCLRDLRDPRGGVPLGRGRRQRGRGGPLLPLDARRARGVLGEDDGPLRRGGCLRRDRRRRRPARSRACRRARASAVAQPAAAFARGANLDPESRPARRVTCACGSSPRARCARRPRRDEKILTTGTGSYRRLARAARAFGSRATRRPRAGRRLSRWRTCRAPDGALRKRWCAGAAGPAGRA
jgi:hypothetical protein